MKKTAAEKKESTSMFGRELIYKIIQGQPMEEFMPSCSMAQNRADLWQIHRANLGQI
jgi:hypothetical protein